MSDVVDLGDFIPKTFKIRFSIEGREYRFEFGEATVDDVLKLLLEGGKEDTMQEARRITAEFLVKHAPEGTDREQLKKDLELVPYQSQRGELDISKLYTVIRQRYQKKDLGAGKAPTRRSLFGWFARSRS